ncbi:MAG: hypothetical protein ABR923_10405 [Terracidiphilus sp.]|jgi:hypothetical protein
MEISPIAGIRALPVAKTPPIDPQLTAVFDIDNSARIGDETWTPSDRESSRGSEDDGSDDPLVDDELGDVEDLPGAEAEPRASMSRAEMPLTRQISFFA